jgi:molybdopterin synthase catalytic subunit
MTIDPRRRRVLLFAGLKERLKRAEVELELEGEPTVADLLAALGRAFPEIAPDLAHCRVAIDQAFARPDDPLPAGAEIAVIPPVSGGHDGPRSAQGTFVHGACRLTDEPLELEAVVAAVEHRGAGGVVSFVGNVREHSRGKTVEHLEYEAYGPMAVRVMAEIAAEIEARVENTRVAIHHRVGRLEIGEAAVVIAASAPHRAEAFTACRDAIEALKRDVPIWKKEFDTDGAAWIGKGP